MPDERIVVHSALFETHVVDASTVPIFSEVMLTTGTINPDGSAAINLSDPLDSDEMFVGQETDFSPFFVKQPRRLANKIRRGIARGEIQNLFLVLRIPTTTPYPGVSGQPPLIGLNVTAPDSRPLVCLERRRRDFQQGHERQLPFLAGARRIADRGGNRAKGAVRAGARTASVVDSSCSTLCA